MVTNEIEVNDQSLTVEKISNIASRRSLNRRNFMTALGVAGAAGAALVSRSEDRPNVVQAQSVPIGPTQIDILNFALNLEYLEATFYSYITQGTDLPPAATIGSGAITGAPAAKLVFTGANAAQITDILNEIYFDELNHVLDLRSVLGSLAVNRPAINLAAYAAITATNALTIARVFEDVGVTAYAGAAALLTGTNLTYAAQILAVEGFHAGALRLIALQNPTIAAYAPPNSSTFTGTTTLGSNLVTGASSTIGYPVGSAVSGTGIPAGATVAGTGTLSILLSTNATAAGAVPITVFDNQDVKIADPGSVALASAGPTFALGGFFATSGAGTQNGPTPAGLAFTRTTSQVLSIVYAAAGVPPIPNTVKGGFFPNGMNGLINTI